MRNIYKFCMVETVKESRFKDFVVEAETDNEALDKVNSYLKEKGGISSLPSYSLSESVEKVEAQSYTVVEEMDDLHGDEVYVGCDSKGIQAKLENQ